jgi:hypothetical protein
MLRIVLITTGTVSGKFLAPRVSLYHSLKTRTVFRIMRDCVAVCYNSLALTEVHFIDLLSVDSNRSVHLGYVFTSSQETFSGRQSLCTVIRVFCFIYEYSPLSFIIGARDSIVVEELCY